MRKTGKKLTAAEENELRLWYTEPSANWEEHTLPIGNGDMGVNIYGAIESEHLTFNEKTLWTGGPSDNRPDYMGGNLEDHGRNGETLREVQRLFAEGKTSEAVEKCGQLIGTSDGYGAYQSWGDLYFDYKGVTPGNAVDYVRDLDLKTAVSSVSFVKEGTTYTREFFISYPDNVLVARLEADGADKLNLDVRFPSKQGGKTAAEGDDTLKLSGQVRDNQLLYSSFVKVVNEGGTVTGNGDKLTVAGADAVTLYLSAATDYKQEYPVYRTDETADELDARVESDVDKAIAKGYDKVKEDHIADYQNIFSRVSLDLGQAVSEKPTDQLMSAYKDGSAAEGEKRQLEYMLFQYGRYLTMGSSREDSQLPANLQGVWNEKNDPAWGADYHLNVNQQMNYWPTYVTNMAECAKPLVEYVNGLREPGRITAEIYAGVASGEGEENGFMAHTQNTPFGWTCPGWEFDWGWSPAAVPWILQNCWEYYEFTGDREYMETYLYPMLKEEAKFYDAIMVEDENGKLVSSPAFSPEHGPRTAGNTYEQSLIWQLYEDAAKAADILGVDSDLSKKWKENQANLKGPIEVGESGQIKEWYIETALGKDENGNNIGAGFEHRHISHMMGLYPGDLIAASPKWLEAANVSMNNRTDVTTGWAMAQRIASWARLGEGNHAYTVIEKMFKSNRINQNLWDTHPPFQIDGNFGFTAGVAEMLLQSNMGYINLLPALPDVWVNGSARGLLARGNFEVDMIWKNNAFTEVTLLSKNGGTAAVKAANVSCAIVKDGGGNAVDVVVKDNDRIQFETEQGKTYTIFRINAETGEGVTNHETDSNYRR